MEPPRGRLHSTSTSAAVMGCSHATQSPPVPRPYQVMRQSSFGSAPARIFSRIPCRRSSGRIVWFSSPRLRIVNRQASEPLEQRIDPTPETEEVLAEGLRLPLPAQFRSARVRTRLPLPGAPRSPADHTDRLGGAYHDVRAVGRSRWPALGNAEALQPEHFRPAAAHDRYQHEPARGDAEEAPGFCDGPEQGH